jgi:hypothetical protein
MDMSYQEKSILGSLIAVVAVYGYYFASVLRDASRPEFDGGNVARLVFTVVALVVIEVIYHIVLALESKVEPKDERDILIECKAYRNAYFLLVGGACWLITGVILANLMPDAIPASILMSPFLILAKLVRESPPTRIIVTPFLTVNLVLFFMVLAELMKFLTQLFYYRRGLR